MDSPLGNSLSLGFLLLQLNRASGEAFPTSHLQSSFQLRIFILQQDNGEP